MRCGRAAFQCMPADTCSHDAAVDAPPTLAVTAAQQSMGVALTIDLDDAATVWCVIYPAGNSTPTLATVVTDGTQYVLSLGLHVRVMAGSHGGSGSKVAYCVAQDAVANAGGVIPSPTFEFGAWLVGCPLSVECSRCQVCCPRADVTPPVVASVSALQSSPGVVTVVAVVDESSQLSCALVDAADPMPSAAALVATSGSVTVGVVPGEHNFNITVSGEGQRVVYCAAVDGLANQGAVVASEAFLTGELVLRARRALST